MIYGKSFQLSATFVRRFSQNESWTRLSRGYLVAVTQSKWQLRVVRVNLFFLLFNFFALLSSKLHVDPVIATLTPVTAGHETATSYSISRKLSSTVLTGRLYVGGVTAAIHNNNNNNNNHEDDEIVNKCHYGMHNPNGHVN